MNIKIEHTALVNLRTGIESEAIRIGVIDNKGQMDKTEIKYETENGKVKVA